MIRVLIVDDHLVVREGLRMLLESSPKIEVVGEAENGDICLRLAMDLKPDVVLMDIRMQGMDGIHALRELAVREPETAVIVLTTYDEDDLLVAAVQSGAHGYLLKDTDRETLLRTIEAASRGEILFSAGILARIVSAQRSQDRVEQGSTELTSRESESLSALLKGMSNKAIAKELGIAERTVKSHLASVYEKLGVRTRTEAVIEALRRRAD